MQTCNYNDEQVEKILEKSIPCILYVHNKIGEAGISFDTIEKCNIVRKVVRKRVMQNLGAILNDNVKDGFEHVRLFELVKADTTNIIEEVKEAFKNADVLSEKSKAYIAITTKSNLTAINNSINKLLNIEGYNVNNVSDANGNRKKVTQTDIFDTLGIETVDKLKELSALIEYTIMCIPQYDEKVENNNNDEHKCKGHCGRCGGHNHKAESAETDSFRETENNTYDNIFDTDKAYNEFIDAFKKGREVCASATSDAVSKLKDIGKKYPEIADAFRTFFEQ